MKKAHDPSHEATRHPSNFTVETLEGRRLLSGAAPQVQGFTLVNASNEQPLFQVTNGAVLNLAELPEGLNLRADVARGTGAAAARSVRFGYDARSNFRLETGSPYALFGDDRGDYFAGNLTPGKHTVKATPFNTYNGSGPAGQAKTITFTVVDPPRVTGFTLINADTDQPVRTIADGDTLNLADLPTANLNVRADVDGQVRSVRFGFGGNGNFRLERGAPFALFGDTGGDYFPGALPAGQYTVTATPFKASNATGAGAARTVNFTVAGQQQPAGKLQVTSDGAVVDNPAAFHIGEGGGAVVELKNIGNAPLTLDGEVRLSNGGDASYTFENFGTEAFPPEQDSTFTTDGIVIIRDRRTPTGRFASFLDPASGPGNLIPKTLQPGESFEFEIVGNVPGNGSGSGSLVSGSGFGFTGSNTGYANPEVQAIFNGTLYREPGVTGHQAVTFNKTTTKTRTFTVKNAGNKTLKIEAPALTANSGFTFSGFRRTGTSTNVSTLLLEFSQTANFTLTRTGSTTGTAFFRFKTNDTVANGSTDGNETVVDVELKRI